MTVLLPEYDAERLHHDKDTIDEKALNSKAFTDGILLLFKVVSSSWSSRANEVTRPDISPTIAAESPTDLTNTLGRSRWSRSTRWEKSYLELTNGALQDLSALLMISPFNYPLWRLSRSMSPSLL